MPDLSILIWHLVIWGVIYTLNTNFYIFTIFQIWLNLSNLTQVSSIWWLLLIKKTCSLHPPIIIHSSTYIRQKIQDKISLDYQVWLWPYLNLLIKICNWYRKQSWTNNVNVYIYIYIYIYTTTHIYIPLSSIIFFYFLTSSYVSLPSTTTWMLSNQNKIVKGLPIMSPKSYSRALKHYLLNSQKGRMCLINDNTQKNSLSSKIDLPSVWCKLNILIGPNLTKSLR